MKNTTIMQFLCDVSSNVKKHITVPNKFHDLLHETDRESIVQYIGDFAFGSAVQMTNPAPLLNADELGPSAERYRELQCSLPWWNPKRWYFSGTRWTLATVGRLAEGINLGWTTGFNSGAMLDHVF